MKTLKLFWVFKTNRLQSIYFLFVGSVFLISCKNTEPTKDINNTYIPLPTAVQAPTNNPITPDKIALGKLLFYDPILSVQKDVSCATCHHPNFGYAEPLDLSIGVNGIGLGKNRHFKSGNTIPLVKRNSQTILNTAFNGISINGEYKPEQAPMFWDLRAQSLEKQSLHPIQALEEMRGTKIPKNIVLDTIIKRLNRINTYKKLFANAFPNIKKIDTTTLGMTLASFERSLITPNTRFDNFIAGDKTALSLTEQQGFKLFKRAKCTLCHSGPMFSDYKPHVLGVLENSKLNFVDTGFKNNFSFRTPSLRNLKYTAPYMHNGKLTSLKKVLDFYTDISNGKSQNPNVKKLDPLVKELKLRGKDISPILAFLKTLNATGFDTSIPESVPSGFPVGGAIH